MKVIGFVTDAAAVAGFGLEAITGVIGAVTFPRAIRIMAIKQPAGAVLANDADWTLWTNYASTGQAWAAEELDPVNDGGVKLGPSGITIAAYTPIQMAWAGQGAAQANQVTLYYEWA